MTKPPHPAEADPAFGLTPGAEIDNRTKYWSTCKTCQASILMGQIQDVWKQIKWRAFDAQPVQSGGLNFYRRHTCPR